MKRLLVIDDCEIHHFIMDKMLSNAGIFEEREKSFNAETAIKQLEADRLDADKLPDIIFLDLFMPGFNGFDFLERFKKLRPLLVKTIHILVITCSIHQADKTKIGEYVFVEDFLIKPVSKQNLQALALTYGASLQL